MTFGTLRLLSYPALRHWLLGTAALIPLSFALLHFKYAPPVISHDSVIGWQAWRSMQAGAGWNEIAWPDPENIARSQGGFLSWWTPGQYLPLGLLTNLGLSLGGAAILTSLLGAWSLAFGSWRLCLALGASDGASALAALAVSATWHTLYALGYYIGGEVMLLALWPWIVLAAWRTRHLAGWQPVILAALFLLGSYAKLSFTLYAVALLLFLWLEEGRAARWHKASLVRSGFRLGGAAIIYLAAWYWLHFDRGVNPTATGERTASVVDILGFALGGPWYAAGGLGSLLGRLAGSGGMPALGVIVPWLLLLAGIAGFFGLAKFTLARPVLLRLAGVVSLVAGSILGVILLRGSSVSLEDRHLRPAGILLLAAGAAAVDDDRVRAAVRRLVLLVLSLAMAYGIGAGGQRILNLRRNTLRGPNDIAALNLNPLALHRLQLLDRPGQLIFLSDLMHAPLLSQARILIADSPGSWRGRVPHLALMLPAGAPASDLLARFVDYGPDEWKFTREGSWQFWFADRPDRLAAP